MANWTKKHQRGKIDPNADFYHVLISGLEVWGTYDELEDAYNAAEEADAQYPAEIIWISDSNKNRDPMMALEEFGYGRSAKG